MLRIYNLVTWIVLPIVILRLYWRSLKSPGYRHRIKERFGIIDGLDIPARPLWIHAVSVGEAQAIAPFVRHVLSKHPEQVILITTTTPTGASRVKSLFGDDVFHLYFPYDIKWSIDSFLDRVNPVMLLMVETEIWPNLLMECEKRNIPSLLANARLSQKSARSYARFSTFTAELFSKIGCVAAQSENDADRFVSLGVPRNRVSVTGSIKFDVKIPASIQEQVQVVRRVWGEDRKVWVAASTHEGEEEILLEAHRTLCQQLPNALLVLVPRHPERFEKVALLTKKHGFNLIKRSTNEVCNSNHSVFLGDTMGELPVFLGAADVAFIGGSLVRIGGHNMLEAAAQGVPVLFGPQVYNFSKIAALLLEAEAAIKVNHADELAKVLGDWLSNASERSRVGENGRMVVEKNRGALQKLIALFENKYLFDSRR